MSGVWRTIVLWPSPFASLFGNVKSALALPCFHTQRLLVSAAREMKISFFLGIVESCSLPPSSP